MRYKATCVSKTVMEGSTLATLVVEYPRFIHSEVMTHRSLAKNASSSRAIPIQCMIDLVGYDPVVPVRFGENRRGMQDTGQAISDEHVAKQLWLHSAMAAVSTADSLNHLHVHKQVVNRVLEPYSPIKVVITGNAGLEGYGWDWFIKLRNHPAAQPEIQVLAQSIADAIYSAETIEDDLHLPFITPEERAMYPEQASLRDLLKVSGARCGRVSYFYMEPLSFAEEIAFSEDKMLALDHWSPYDHQGVAVDYDVIASAFESDLRAWLTTLVSGQGTIPPGIDCRHLRGWVPGRVYLGG